MIPGVRLNGCPVIGATGFDLDQGKIYMHDGSVMYGYVTVDARAPAPKLTERTPEQ